jgi:hypothetical protein
MFEPGQSVVCVFDVFEPGINDIFNDLPQKGLIYTVRDIVPAQTFQLRGTCAVLLEELVNKPNQHGIEPGFLIHRFAEVSPEQQAQIEAQLEAISNLM